MNCKKCDSPMTVILRKKDYYCNDCFMTNTNHKFRACIGKNKILSPNENVLICLSGGKGSTVLLDLVHHSISLDPNKKLRIVPVFLHLYDFNGKAVAETILHQCEKYNCNVYIASLSEYMNRNIELPKTNCIPDIENNGIKEFHDMLNCMPPTAANDFLKKIKHDLFVKFAKKLNCTAIFTAETTNTLAINLLCNLAIGRGSQVQNDIGFSDIRDKNVKILRPMKDISQEELDYYIKIKQLYLLCSSDIKTNSIQAVISSFVSDLQENFQATISTVCKTADKIGNCDEGITQQKCIICMNDLHTKDIKLSALEATNVSRTVSLGNTHSKHDEDALDLLNVLENSNSTPMFPFINKSLCYGCSRNNSEMSQSKLPPHIQEVLRL